MKILVIVLLMDITIFAFGAVFAEKEHEVIDSKKRSYHVDRYGYYWKVGE